MAQSWWILMTFVIPAQTLRHYHELDVCDSYWVEFSSRKSVFKMSLCNQLCPLSVQVNVTNFAKCAKETKQQRTNLVLHGPSKTESTYAITSQANTVPNEWSKYFCLSNFKRVAVKLLHSSADHALNPFMESSKLGMMDVPWGSPVSYVLAYTSR